MDLVQNKLNITFANEQEIMALIGAKNFDDVVEFAKEIENKVNEVEVEITPISFEDARNYQVSSQKLKNDTGFQASIDLVKGIDEVYDLIFNNRIKDITDPRYSNQNFLQKFGVS